jgi:hypothetical protein
VTLLLLLLLLLLLVGVLLLLADSAVAGTSLAAGESSGTWLLFVDRAQKKNGQAMFGSATKWASRGACVRMFGKSSK